MTAALRILCLQLSPPSPSTFDEIKSIIDTNTGPPGKNSHQNGKNRCVYDSIHIYFCHFDDYFFQVDLCTRMRLLDFTLHYGEHWIVLPGDASWKRLCSSSVPPDDDDDMTVYKVAHILNVTTILYACHHRCNKIIL